MHFEDLVVSVPGGVIANYQERTAELVPNDGVSSINSISAFGEDAAGELYIVDYTGASSSR